MFGFPTETDIEIIEAYMVGFIEATIDTEASLDLVKGIWHSRYSKGISWGPRLSIHMTKGDVKEFLEQFKEACGAGKVVPKKEKDKYGNEYTGWRYFLLGKALRPILKDIRLIIKEEHRLLLLEAMGLLYDRETYRISKETHERLHEIHLRIKELNSSVWKQKLIETEKWQKLVGR